MKCIALLLILTASYASAATPARCDKLLGASTSDAYLRLVQLYSETLSEKSRLLVLTNAMNSHVPLNPARAANGVTATIFSAAIEKLISQINPNDWNEIKIALQEWQRADSSNTRDRTEKFEDTSFLFSPQTSSRASLKKWIKSISSFEMPSGRLYFAIAAGDRKIYVFEFADYKLAVAATHTVGKNFELAVAQQKNGRTYLLAQTNESLHSFEFREDDDKLAPIFTRPAVGDITAPVSLGHGESELIFLTRRENSPSFEVNSVSIDGSIEFQILREAAQTRPKVAFLSSQTERTQLFSLNGQQATIYENTPLGWTASRTFSQLEIPAAGSDPITVETSPRRFLIAYKTQADAIQILDYDASAQKLTRKQILTFDGQLQGQPQFYELSRERILFSATEIKDEKASVHFYAVERKHANVELLSRLPLEHTTSSRLAHVTLGRDRDVFAISDYNELRFYEFDPDASNLTQLNFEKYYSSYFSTPIFVKMSDGSVVSAFSDFDNYLVTMKVVRKLKK